MPPLWQLTPDATYAVCWRLKGRARWIVLDLDTDEAVHEIAGPGHNEPRLAFGSSGSVAVGIHDRLHFLDSVVGQLSAGRRLRNDRTGSAIRAVSHERDTSLLVTWFGNHSDLASRMKAYRGSRNRHNVEELLEQLAADRCGAILRFATEHDRVTEAALFPDWVTDPVVLGNRVVAAQWPNRAVATSRFHAWPTYAPRAPDATNWL